MDWSSIGYDPFAAGGLAELRPMSPSAAALQQSGLAEIRRRMEWLAVKDPRLLERFLLEHPQTYRIFAGPPPAGSDLGVANLSEGGGSVFIDPARGRPASTAAHEFGHVSKQMSGSYGEAPPGLAWNYRDPTLQAIVAERGRPPAAEELWAYWLEGSPMVSVTGLEDLRQWVEAVFGRR